MNDRARDTGEKEVVRRCHVTSMIQPCLVRYSTLQSLFWCRCPDNVDQIDYTDRMYRLGCMSR